jgi:protein MpaA
MRRIRAFFLIVVCLVSAPAFGAPEEPGQAPISEDDRQRLAQVDEWCASVRKTVKELRWKVDPCDGVTWRAAGQSVEKRPLVYAEFGDPKAENTTLIFSMVHGDEVTPLFLAIQLARWMKNNQASMPGARVVIAPLVNPDGFFSIPRKRVNARGVDVNRNFHTHDWSKRALNAWRIKYRSDPRRYPGSRPNSEPETVFQRELIDRVRPQKILSVHAPLNFIDYDGPTATVLSLSKFPREYVRECMRLRQRVKAVSSGFFPGSLGNYAGQELGIPTLTLELPSADSRKALAYWDKFKPGIRTMIEFKVPDIALRATAAERQGGS